MKYLILILSLCSIETFACNKEDAFRRLDGDAVEYAKQYQAVARSKNMRAELDDIYREAYDITSTGPVMSRLGTMLLTTTKNCQYFTYEFIRIE